MKGMFNILAAIVMNVAMVSTMSVSRWFFYEPEMPDELRKK